MTVGWVVVARGDHDVEEVLDARSVLAECPSCDARVRLTERELVRNLKVLGVALLATERAGRVFQCPQCDALCVREGDDLPLGLRGAETDDARAEALTERVLKAEDDALLWSQRATVATSRGEEALAEEMRAQSARSSRAAQVLRRELAALTGARGGHSAAEDTAQGPTPPALPAAQPEAPAEVAEPPAPQADTLEDELAALRARVLERRRPQGAPAVEKTAASVPDDELASLKAKLGRAPATTAEAPTPEEAPQPPEAPPAAPPSDDDELAAMKRSLRKK